MMARAKTTTIVVRSQIWWLREGGATVPRLWWRVNVTDGVLMRWAARQLGERLRDLGVRLVEEAIKRKRGGCWRCLILVCIMPIG